jgi:outer membrane protein TolC
MEDEKKVEVETKVDETDWEAKYLETQANLDKVAAERENYKKGMLAAKGKSDDDESEEDKIARIVEEKLQGSTEAQLLKQKDEIAKRALQENKELKVALKNRTQIGASAGQGGGQGGDVKTDFWTPEQLAYFKKRGIDPEKAKENYLKLKNN